jgi:RNA polymerase subunit RPABC4/transcription elongation factor Spt4
VARTCKACSSILASGSTNCPNCGAVVTMRIREIIFAILVCGAVLFGALV